MLTYGGNRRSAEISNLFTFKFKSKGLTYYIPLIFTTYTSKQNQYSCFKTIKALYNKKPLICILSGLAFYLLCHYDFSNEPFLDFSKRLVWYNIYIIKSSTKSHKVAFLYNSQREWVAKAFQYVRIFLQKKTHVRQNTGAKIAELKRVSKDQIRRASR